MASELQQMLSRLYQATDALYSVVVDLSAFIAQMENPNLWTFPVDDPASWYCATWHDLSGVKNRGYRHSGIDLNLDRAPWGDVERGAAVYAMAAGRVIAATSSSGWLGVVQVQHEHDGAPLWTRYAHLDPARLEVAAGGEVHAGSVLGYIGDWRGGDGGDHLHLDMATTAFYWAAWLSGDAWVDPVPVLKAHLLETMVEALLAKQ
ncbi:MAG: M23 family metallopeptidase [Anaerolineae bacterium]|nr:M23 family metallopeptidase [Anaerolineae bacterium]